MFRYILAVGLIILGAALVLANIGIIDFQINDYWNLIIPLILLLLGLKLFIDDFKYKGGSWIFGSLFVIFGGLLLLGELAIIDFTFSDIIKLWPLLIIYIGYSIIKPRRKHRPHVHVKDDKKETYNKRTHRFSIGDYEFKKQNWKVEPMDLWNAAGDYYIDFSKAFIPEKEIPITINSWAGDVQILLPEHVAFRVDASVKAGEINILDQTADGMNRSILYESTNYETAIRKLDIKLKLKAGSIRVDVV
ncbi:cell wall-active antibiotics response protein LiaF [Lentibacillus sp. Marseille-P4043]|uniref:cell wall-active antibiotics response protein LiaF n=1 Tax=Lentibacillus sp. Marseille-P4043 TaxID=2040293 RepID=UPI000D0B843D|nr:cell wall-active antibiotics response protein LiaF [Lentibacillus sp. Marseille-P4043]